MRCGGDAESEIANRLDSVQGGALLLISTLIADDDQLGKPSHQWVLALARVCDLADYVYPIGFELPFCLALRSYLHRSSS